VIPCGLIINELVSNALKYAFPEDKQGEIFVEFVFDDADKQYALRVKDNGIGWPKKIDFRKTQSLGLQLVTILVDQLGGTIELAAQKQGTEFIITFKKDAKSE
jgi:two-component sensor histidine kinase